MKWHTEIRKISDLKNWESNPRTITDESFDELTSSVDELGNFEPLVIDVDGTVIAGNQRLRAAKVLKETEIEVSVPEKKLTEEEIKKIGLISNRHSGEWDMDKLANEFEDTLEELGFDDLMPEIVAEVEEDDYEEPEELETTVVLGDVYQLGEHRLMCGDSTKIEDVEKLMNGQKADMVFTDPPYNVAVNDESEESLKARNRRTDGLKIKNDKMSSDGFDSFLSDCFTNLYVSLRDGGSIYICYADSMTIPFITNFTAVGFHFAQNCIWNKQQFVMTRKDYHYKHEPILYGWKLGVAHTWNTDRKQSSVWDFDRPFKSELHPTMKPVELVSYPIQNSSKKGDVILDTFGGSGSTLIACEQTNRKCYMMELDPYYTSVIINRWETYTGKEAKKL